MKTAPPSPAKLLLALLLPTCLIGHPDDASAQATVSIRAAVHALSSSELGSSEAVQSFALRFGSLTPSSPRPDVALLVSSGGAVDLDLAVAFPLGEIVSVIPRTGASAYRQGFGSGYFLGGNVGVGLLVRGASPIGLRFDATERVMRYQLKGSDEAGRSVTLPSGSLGLAWVGRRAAH